MASPTAAAATLLGGGGGGGAEQRRRPPPASPEAERQAAGAFQALRPLCSRLLFLRADAQQLSAALGELRSALAAAEPMGLQRCFDYAMYPLGFMLDSIAATRGSSSGSSGGGSDSGTGVGAAEGGGGVAVPAMRSDAAAEAALACLRELLRHAAALEPDQAAAAAQRVARLLQLPPGAASEEVRLGVLKATTALLENQTPPAGQRQQRQQQDPVLLLQQHASAPFAGLVISTCLAAADAEVAAAGKGSKAVRRAAVGALRAVLHAVGPGAHLAFFLPGVASGLAKQLLAAVPPSAGVPVTGAAAGSAGTALVLQVLAEAVAMTLGDDAIAHVPDEPLPADGQQPRLAQAPPLASGSDALAMLQQLSLQASSAAAAAGAVAGDREQGQPPTLQSANGGVAPSQPQPLPPAQQQPRRPPLDPSAMRFSVEQDRQWLESSSSKVQALLAMTLPRLLAHQQPAVRRALAEAVCCLLQRAPRAMRSGRQALVEILLTLANDEYQEVSGPALAWLQRSGAAAADGGARPPAAQPAGSAALSELLVGLCVELPQAVRRDEAAGTSAAKRAAAALLCAGPLLVDSCIFSKPATLREVCQALVEAFQLDPSGAALLLRAQAAFAGGEVAADTGEAAAAAASGGGGGGGELQAAASAAAAAATAGARVGGAQPQLPRMPLSLRYLVSASSYKAAAGVARALGRAARTADRKQQQQRGPGPPGIGCVRLLLEQLLEMLHEASSPHKQHHQQQSQQQPAAHGHQQLAAPGARPDAAPAAGEWQCQAGAVAVVATEALFGASDAWQPPMEAAPAQAAEEQQQQQQGASPDGPYEEALLQALSALTAPKLWELPTSQPEPGEGAEAAAGGQQQQQQQPIPAQVLGANALLLRCLIDGVGACGRSAGPRFSANTRLLRTALMPLLERLADPCPLVSAAAAAALASVCRHGGYPLGLTQLVGANTDYIVDGVCRRLRGLQRHPRAPQLLAALLREAGVSAQLLPLLAEPLRAALSGLSILSRKQTPGYTLPFLHVLQSVSAGATSEAAAARGAFRRQLSESVAAARAARLFDAPPPPPEDASGSASGSDEGNGAGGERRAARFFKRRLRQQEQQAQQAGSSQQQQQHQQHQQHQQPAATVAAVDGEGAGADAGPQFPPPLPEGSRLRLPPRQVEELDLAWRRAYSAASLASSAVDAATPLLLQRNLRAAVLAAGVLSVSLEALAAATDALDTEERMFDHLLAKEPDAALKPARPAPVKLLPAVHTIWPVLLACLQDTGSVALLEQGLALLASMVRLAGGRFLQRRFRQEAWPLLQRLASQGPQAGASRLAAAAAASSTGGGAAAASLLGVGGGPGSVNPGLGGGGGGGVLRSALQTLQASAGSGSGGIAGAQDAEGPMAPATLQRVQLAVLGCLASVCASPAAAPVLSGPLVWHVALLAAPYLADGQPLALREGAARLLLAAAEVDADSVWLVLVDLASCHTDLVAMLTPLTAAVEEVAPGASGMLPRLSALLPPAPPADASAGGLAQLLRSAAAASCGRRAAALLPRVEAAPVAWHAKAAATLEQLQSPNGLP